MTTLTVYLLSPEIVLATVAVAIYVLGAFIHSNVLWSRMSAAALLAAGVVLAITAAAGGTRAGPVAIDPLAGYARWFALGAGLILVLMTSRPSATSAAPEYQGSLLLAVTGLMLTASSDELILVFLGLELISIPTYILLFLGRNDPAAREATAKYFFLSILASALLLYGFSFLYGVSGTTDLEAIAARLADPALLASGFGKLAKLALALIFAGLGFKMTAAPFHFYAPDVYQGTSHANAALLSVLPKLAALVALVRIVALAMPGLAPHTWHIAMLLAVASMSLGNLLALWQDNLRRLLAYSSIAHGGYMLIGLTVALADPDPACAWSGIGAVLFYVTLYAIATLGAFAAFTYLGREDRQLDAIEELAGLGRTRPLLAAWIALFMFSLAGIPPLAGFWGKLALFQSALAVDGEGAVRLWFVGLAVVGVLNSAIAAAYYLRVVGVMYFRTPLGTPRAEGGRGAWWGAALCAALVLFLGLYSKPLMLEAEKGGALKAESGKPKAESREAKAENGKPRAGSEVTQRSPFPSAFGFRLSAFSASSFILHPSSLCLHASSAREHC